MGEDFFVRSRRLFSSLVFSALIIPVNDPLLWKIDSFSNAKRHEVSFSEKGMFIKVRRSASPIFFPLKGEVSVVGFKVTGEFTDLPKFSDPNRQGEKGFDDFPLRVGLVIPGANKLTGFKKMVAPSWIKRIYDQIPKERGLDHVQFFNVTQNKAILGKTRNHPASDLLREDFFVFADKAGPFTYEAKIEAPIKTVALWISSDGDDTKSDYDVLISELTLMAQ